MSKKISDNAMEVLKRRYLAKDKDGKIIESVDEMWHRIAHAIAEADRNYGASDDQVHETENQFYEMMSELDFLPNSPTLMNAGRPLGQLSACFVLPIEDSMEGIFNTIRDAALIHKSGGGTGFSFSRLRPAGSTVRSTGGIASGPISFMKAFDAATESVKQGGCFIGTTCILTERGPVQIQYLTKGTMVYSVDTDGNIVMKPCSDPWLTKKNILVWTVTMTNDVTVTGTGDHPVMVGIEDGQYVYKKIQDLVPGDNVISMNRGCDKSDTTRVLSVYQEPHVDGVWNVEIEDTHNYYVCSPTGSDGFFVSNTRRGANMGILRVDHPDIETFIACKNDTHTLNNFNISVAITDTFMKAVQNHTTYDLINPSTKEVTKSLDANEVFDKIIDSAWRTGEPGIFFIDKTNKFNTLKPIYGEIESTNPCLKGDTLILTDRGEVEIQSVVNQVVNVWNGYSFSPVVPRVTGENQETIHIGVIDEHGTTRKIQCTLYHMFILRDGSRVKASELETGMELGAYRLPDKFHFDENNGSVIIDSFLEINDPKVKYIRKGKVLDKVYCFTELEQSAGTFNGILTGNCGEVPLLPYEACNLGSINLKNHLAYDINGNVVGVDWEKLSNTVRNAVHFLDNVIDVNCYPLPQIDEMAKNARKIGLGVMGFADMLLELRIPYNTAEGVEFGRGLMEFINTESHTASLELGSKRGPYPAWLELHRENENIPAMRNNTVTCIAPTGTLSMIADVSSGIEPIFAFAYYKNVMDNTNLSYVNDSLKKILRKETLSDDAYNCIIDEVIKDGTLQHNSHISDDIKKVFVCAHDIAPDWHVLMQAAFQENVDNAISKTINFSHDATRDDVRGAYMRAYETSCKGITVYRDGCRENQVLNVGKADQTPDPNVDIEANLADLTVMKVEPRDRPEEVAGFTRRIPIGCGKLYVTINHDEEGICEIFTSNGKGGGCPSQSEATARLASIALRAGISVDEIAAQLRGIRCPSCQRNPNVKVLSCPDAIGRMIQEAQKRIDEDRVKAETEVSPEPIKIDDNACDDVEEFLKIPPVKTYPSASLNDSDLKFAKNCPECGSPLEHEGGCVICRECGWSKCG